MKQEMECLQTNGSSRFASEDIQELGHEKQYLFNEQVEQVQQVRDQVDMGSTAADTSCYSRRLVSLSRKVKH